MTLQEYARKWNLSLADSNYLESQIKYVRYEKTLGEFHIYVENVECFYIVGTYSTIHFWGGVNHEIASSYK